MFLLRYFPFIKLSFKNHLSHVMRMTFRFCGCFFFMVVFIELWRLIDREGLLEIPYKITDIAWYVSFTQMFLFLSPRFFMVINEDIRSGDIAYFLIRPISYLNMRLLEGIGALSANMVSYYSVGVFLLWLYIGELPSGGILTLITVMIFLYLGSILHLIFQLMAGITAFWLQEAEPMYRIYQKLLIVLGGLYMPLTLYPDWVGKFASFTPFYTMMYMPVRPLLNEGTFFENVIMTLGYFCVWFVLAFMLMGWMYRTCVRRLEVNGG